MTDDHMVDGLSVCGSCAALVANGEADSDDHAAAFVERWDGWHVFLTCHGDEECNGFSSSSCDGCGSRLGGERHPAVAFEI